MAARSILSTLNSFIHHSPQEITLRSRSRPWASTFPCMSRTMTSSFFGAACTSTRSPVSLLSTRERAKDSPVAPAPGSQRSQICRSAILSSFNGPNLSPNAAPPGISPRRLCRRRGDRNEVGSAAYLFDQPILSFKNDVLDVEGAGTCLIDAVGQLRVDGVDDLADTRLHLHRDFHHVGLEKPFDLLERLIERVSEGAARRLFAPQLIEPLVLLVDHPERVSEHCLPLAHLRTRVQGALVRLSAAAGNIPLYLSRLGWHLPQILGSTARVTTKYRGLPNCSSALRRCQEAVESALIRRHVFLSFPSPRFDLARKRQRIKIPSLFFFVHSEHLLG